jgi:hypothetical protein
MLWSRLVAVSVLAAIALSGAGWRLSASQGARPASAAAKTMALGRVRVPPALRRRVEQYLALASRPPGRRAPLPPLRSFSPRIPHWSACYVASRDCSLIPCVQFARITSATAVVHGRPGSAGATCQRRLIVPEIVRVAGP